MISRALIRACLFLGLVGTPLACGFPEYGFPNPSTGGSGGTGASGGGGSGGMTTTSSTGGTGGAGAMGGGGMGGTGGMMVECTIDDDCAQSKNGPVCDIPEGTCVPCLPSNDVCAAGMYCTDDNVCVIGCTDDTDCAFGENGGGAALTCDVATHTCIGCLVDDPCPPGTICDVPTGVCMAGCTIDHACPTGLDCCAGDCSDVASDIDNCGACGIPCAPPGGVGQCDGGSCSLIGCQAGWNDCDMVPDNGCESEAGIDASNCGACGTICAALPNAEPACSGGMCGLGACVGAYANCNNLPADGCEIDTVTDEEHCGACGAFCSLPNAVPLCSGGGCIVASCEFGFEDCDAADANGCETSTQTNVNHCGACGNACNLPNSSAKCEGGACKVDTCAVPFADCNASAADGCETNVNTSDSNCGMCGTVCNLPNATSACSNGSCAVVACSGTFADCDGNPANGCETNLATSAANCGACAAACSTNNGTPACMGGACSIMCNAGYADCNANVSDGCEVNTTTNVNNCGTCGNSCPPQGGVPACSNSTCTVSSCLAGKGDCDGNPNNGCETTITTDAMNCGACGNVCTANNGTAACSAGTCFIASCANGFDDCNNQYADGCETNLKTLANCGSCGTVCNLPNATESCATGTCTLVTCAGTFANCDGNASNGCEVDTASNVNNCGTCGNICPPQGGTPTCSNSSCTVSSCSAGKGDCDGNPGNGCETTITNDPMNCGGCGIVCFAANGNASCNNGTCVVASCNAGFDDCNNQYSDGCETNLKTLANCGSCGTVCDLANASESCSTGVCQLASCSGTYANCDNNPANGCEVDTGSSIGNCGACGNACSSTNGTASCTAGACGISCNAGFGNCDGNLANGCEATTTTDASNCGSCGNVCFAANGNAACNAGTCYLSSCNAGYENCNGQYADGCETNTKTLANCGGCGVTCDLANATESCSTGTCTLVSCSGTFANCDMNDGNGCEINTATNVSNCSACGNVCSSTNGSPSCTSGACGISCAAGFGNCDANVTNGCETATTNNINACGGCGIVCSAPNGTPACSGTQCVIQSCSAPYQDCNSMYADGCEANLNTSTANCGACGITCTNANGTTSCQSGLCSPSCAGGYGNCDGNANNGCETNTSTSLSNCGACGNVCNLANATPVCSSGSCAIQTCNGGFGNCDLIAANGCETALNTVSNCGSCGTTCTNANGTTSCQGGLCSPMCNSGFLSCDGNPNNGCETNIHTLANCGGCGVACDYLNASESCSTGTCTFGACDAGWGNCDGNLVNGCETNTNTDNQHCGNCATSCMAGEVCVNGTCQSTCPAGTADCDGNPGNGCEVNTTTDSTHCGTCAIACSASQYCNAGACAACSAGTTDCDKNGGNGCEVTVATNAANCGGCGISCGSDATCGCSAGMCSGGTIYFSEDFSDNSRGWTLDTEWAIGPTAVSSGQQQGFPDPANDHSPSSDNGVAGIVLGGNYIANPIHDFYYMTSPVIDLSGAAGTVNLSFWRWLNCDYDPYVIENVQVWNGSAWVTLWTSSSVGNNLITDSAWTRYEYDVTAYKNASFQIRFGHDTGKQGNFVAWVMSGWNIDDLSLASGTCN